LIIFLQDNDSSISSLNLYKRQLMLGRKSKQGFTLTELIVAMAVSVATIAVGVPSFSTYTNHQQIKADSEKVVNALRLAREEAIKRNTAVQFSLVNSLNGECALVGSGPHVVVSRTNPGGRCDAAPSESVDPYIIRIVEDQDSSKTSISAHDGNGNARTSVIFTGLGRVVTASNDWIRQIDLDLKSGSARRPLRVLIPAFGDIRTCDPSVTTATDPRKC
jgi:type IV fimbrial biogenesis protein FimT